MSLQTITTRFEHAKISHYSKIFYQPLYYISNNLIQSIYKNTNNDTYNAKYDTKYVDDRFEFYPDTNIKLELTNSDNIGSENASIESINLNFILDRYNTNFKFKYNGCEFTIKTDDIIKKYPVPVGHAECTISSTYEITCNASDLSLFNDFIKQSIKYYHKNFEGSSEDANKITIYISNSEGDYFSFLGKRNKRSLDTIYLPSKQKKEIIDDITNFIKLETKVKYERLGINYKRVYLLEGIPGAGKSSLIFSLASYFNYSIAIISFTPKMTDVNIMRALRSLEDNDDKDNNKIKKKYFIVFEDMDCIFKERKSNDENKNMVTFSGILNALDGITTPENMISFITTNFKSNLDSALIRPGRVDKIITFDYAIKEQVIEMYKKYTCEFYESLDIDKKCDEFYEVLCNLNIKTSTSLLQQYLMCHLDNPEGAIKNIKEMKKMYEASKVNNFETAEAGLYN